MARSLKHTRVFDLIGEAHALERLAMRRDEQAG